MNNKKRCEWVPLDNPLYVKYHDEEWGVPIHDDQLLFEFLILEGMQAGLSWLTILRKRENFRTAFHHFDPRKVAQYDEKKIESLMQNSGIIRNRLKIQAAVQNAKAFLEVQAEFGSFDAFIWQFLEGKPIINQWKTLKEIPAKTPLSDTISKELKKRGFQFVGSTIVYAHMQATGMVNDHTIDCFRYNEVRGLCG
ncbi:MAG: DNA-3-methyladenine glycosylase I [Candidatus Aminicenantes bacterium]|nr:MAG: DNA-3-methyladenine glycosylase I [Candidatus Aminicenantes bacterium]